MNITSKSRYALKIMLDLAEHTAAVDEGTTPLVQRGSIAGRQGIPPDYMDQILGRLRDADLVASTRGRRGGFRLTRAPADISAWDIMAVVEDVMHPVLCLDDPAACGIDTICSSRDAWSKISGAIERSLKDLSLAVLRSEESGKTASLTESVGRVHECRAPRRH